MAENETSADQVRSVIAQNLEQAHKAITNCFEMVERNIASSPLGAADQTKTFRSYVERSVAASFELSDKILHAKNLQDVLHIQTEFFSKATAGVDRARQRSRQRSHQKDFRGNQRTHKVTPCSFETDLLERPDDVCSSADTVEKCAVRPAQKLSFAHRSISAPLKGERAVSTSQGSGG
jgi:hypothetical protein